jgi:hypothetical protein
MATRSSLGSAPRGQAVGIQETSGRGPARFVNHLSDFLHLNINGVGLCTKYDITTISIFSGQTIEPRRIDCTIALQSPEPKLFSQFPIDFSILS